MMFVLAATLAVGCKDKAAPAPAGGSGSAASAGSAGSGSAAASAVGSGSGSAAEPTPSVLVLPKLEGEEATKGPDKPGKPLTQADWAKLQDIKYVGFAHEQRALSEHLFDVRHTTEARPRLAVVVRMMHCSKKKDVPEEVICRAMAADAWKGRADAVKAGLKGGLATDPKTVVEIGELDVGGGQKAIWQYNLGFNVGQEEQGAGAYTNQYIIHFNDGVNQMHVTAEYKDDPAKTMQDMLNLAPREDLAKIARAFFDVYSHAWGD